MSKKALIYISIALFILLGISIYSQYRANMEKNLYRHIFVNHFYYELNTAINLLSGIREGSGPGVQENFKTAVSRLERMDSMLADANAFMDRSLVYHVSYSFWQIYTVLNEGYGLNNQKLCDGFLADSKISQSELNFLTSLREDLEQIKNNMYSKETGQENPNLTIHEINNILAPFFSKYYEIKQLNPSN